MGWKDADGLARVLAVMLGIDAAWLSLALLVSRAARLAPDDAELLAGVGSLFKIAVMIVFARWLFVAGRRLVDAGVEGLDFTPASRIWWFFVPVANLVKPHAGMRELHNASLGRRPLDRNDLLVGCWWGLWLLNGLVAYGLTLAFGMQPQATGAKALSGAIDLAVGAAAILLVLRIAAAQSRLVAANLKEVFA